jgi:hypothetical protein
LGLSTSSFLALVEAAAGSIPAIANGPDLDITLESYLEDGGRERDDCLFVRGVTCPPFFKRITHLYLPSISTDEELNIAHLPRLTHLAVHIHGDSRVVPGIIRRAQMVGTIQMIVVVLHTNFHKGYATVDGVDIPWVEAMRHYLQELLEPRLYLVESRERYGLEHEFWREEADGEPSIWEKAVDFSRKIGLVS